MTARRADWVVLVVAPDETRRVWRFTPGEVRIGRDESCTVRLDGPEISGVHLRLLLGADTAAVLNPGSRRETLRAGAALPVGEAVALTTGELLEIGAWRITVTRDEAGGVTTDSRDFDLRVAALHRLRDAPTAGTGPTSSPTPVSGAPPMLPSGRADRLYTAAFVIAGLGAVLAGLALVYALAAE